MYIGICQAIMLFLMAINLGSALVKHGESEPPKKYNFWITLLGAGFEFV